VQQGIWGNFSGEVQAIRDQTNTALDGVLRDIDAISPAVSIAEAAVANARLATPKYDIGTTRVTDVVTDVSALRPGRGSSPGDLSGRGRSRQSNLDFDII
jgi:hypothetical protein